MRIWDLKRWKVSTETVEAAPGESSGVRADVRSARVPLITSSVRSVDHSVQKYVP